MQSKQFLMLTGLDQMDLLSMLTMVDQKIWEAGMHTSLLKIPILHHSYQQVIHHRIPHRPQIIPTNNPRHPHQTVIMETK